MINILKTRSTNSKTSKDNTWREVDPLWQLINGINSLKYSINILSKKEVVSTLRSARSPLIINIIITIIIATLAMCCVHTSCMQAHTHIATHYDIMTHSLTHTHTEARAHTHTQTRTFMLSVGRTSVHTHVYVFIDHFMACIHLSHSLPDLSCPPSHLLLFPSPPLSSKTLTSSIFLSAWLPGSRSLHRSVQSVPHSARINYSIPSSPVHADRSTDWLARGCKVTLSLRQFSSRLRLAGWEFSETGSDVTCKARGREAVKDERKILCCCCWVCLWGKWRWRHGECGGLERGTTTLRVDFRFN